MIKEKVLVIPNQNRIAVSLAYKDKGSFNMRVFTPIELAREALLRCGKICNKKFVSKDEELIYYKQIMGTVSYFKTSKLADIKNVNQTINTIRKLVIYDEPNELKNRLSKGVFKEKNNALYEVYKKYIDKLNKEDMVDSIGLIRYAIENAKKIDFELIVLKEYFLQPLEIELIKKVSDYQEPISLFNMYKIEKKRYHINSYKNCYGSSNEVGTIVSDIFANYNADQCVVACADYPTYSQIFHDYACKYNLKITFGNGLSLINSYPGKLLQQYYYWASDGNFGWEPFFKLIYSPYFNFDLLNSLVDFTIEKRDDISNFWLKLSKLRLTNNKEENERTIKEFKKSISREINNYEKLNKFVPSIERIANEFSLPIEDFLAKYFRIRNNKDFANYDNAAKETIINELKTIRNIGLKVTNDVIETLLKKPVYRQGNKPKHIHITSIDGAMSSLRNNLFICGLSSTIYPGSPRENPLLLDDDLKAFDNHELSSTGLINMKKEIFFNLVELASSLDNNINLSYAGLNVSELKNNNASSLMYEVYKRENDEDITLKSFKELITKVGYFDPKLSKSREIGISYNNKDIIDFVEQVSNNDKTTSIKLNKYSPTALNTFFTCRKKFYYQNILELSSPDDYNPYEIISASEQGSLIHALMEYLPDHSMNKDDFVKFSSVVFDEYMKISVPLIKENIQNIKKQFLDMVANGWQFDNDNKREIAFKEKDKETIHDESGIKIYGFPDRVELTEDGKAVIIDFKTENKLDNHKKDDIDSCLQVLIYAYIVEKEMNIKIDHCEYRMLRFPNGIITCKYDQTIKDDLAKKLIEFKNAVENCDYHIDPFYEKEEKEKCKYCKFGSICGKEVLRDDD